MHDPRGSSLPVAPRVEPCTSLEWFRSDNNGRKKGPGRDGGSPSPGCSDTGSPESKRKTCCLPNCFRWNANNSPPPAPLVSRAARL